MLSFPAIRSAARAAALLALATSCTRSDVGSDRGSEGDSTVGDSIATGVVVTPPLASDATLRIVTAAPVSHAVRAVADSFSAREAVRVELDTIPFAAESANASPRNADLIVLTEPPYQWALAAEGGSSWSLRFAHFRVVLAWSDSSRGVARFRPEAWWQSIIARGVRVGRADSTHDRLRHATDVALRAIADSLELRAPIVERLMRIGTTDSTSYDADALAAAVRDRAIDYAFTYEAAARAAALNVLPIGAATPVLMSIPRRSTNPPLAERFVRFAFSPEGRTILSSAGLVVDSMVVAIGTDLPAAVAAVATHVESRDTSAGAADTARAGTVPR